MSDQSSVASDQQLPTLCDTCEPWADEDYGEYARTWCGRIHTLLNDVVNNYTKGINSKSLTAKLRKEVLEANTGMIDAPCLFHKDLILIKNLIGACSNAKQMFLVAQSLQYLTRSFDFTKPGEYSDWSFYLNLLKGFSGQKLVSLAFVLRGIEDKYTPTFKSNDFKGKFIEYAIIIRMAENSAEMLFKLTNEFMREWNKISQHRKISPPYTTSNLNSPDQLDQNPPLEH